LEIHLSRKPLLALAATAALALGSSVANAGPYSDDLGKCLVASTTEQDKSQLVEWIFFSLALNPKISPYAEISAAQREATDKKLARLFEKLLADSCNAQAKQAMKYEGMGALSESFRLLGQVAAQEIFADPAVAAGTAKFSEHLDEARLRKALGAPEPGQ